MIDALAFVAPDIGAALIMYGLGIILYALANI